MQNSISNLILKIDLINLIDSIDSFYSSHYLLMPLSTLAILCIAEIFSHLSTHFYFKKKMIIYHRLDTITSILYIIFLILLIITLYFLFFSFK